MSPDARRRFARQQLLPEVGPEGQARLIAHRFSAGDDRASEVAALYLERAGAQRVDGAEAIPVSAAALTTDPALAEAAAFLAGAFAAVERIKQVLDVGVPGSLDGVSLSGPARDGHADGADR